jgi:branched-chain amino acid transport system substrate-binding protein
MVLTDRRGPGVRLWLAAAAVALLGFGVLRTVWGEPWPGTLQVGEAVKAAGGSAELGFHLMSSLGPDGQPMTRPAPSTVPSPEGDGSGSCPIGTTIAVAGQLSGSYTAFAEPVFNGTELAVTQFIAKNPGCPITLQRLDTGKTPEQVQKSIAQLAADPTLLAVIGPVFSSDAQRMGADLSTAGLPLLSLTTRPDLTQQGWSTYFRGVANDDDAPAATGRYIAGGFTKVCAVSLSYPDTTEAWSSATAGMASLVDPACSESLFANEFDFPRIVTAIKQAAPDAVYFVGDPPRASDLLLQLRNAGVRAVFFGWERVYDDEFLQRAGPAARGTITGGTFQDPREPFLTAYHHAYARDPGPYAVESYELTTIVLTAIGSAGVTDRTSMTSYLRGYSGNGSDRRYQWTANGELVTPPVWLYQVW